MNTLIAVYASHDNAVKAIDNLKKSGYPVNQVSLVAKADIRNNHIYLKPNNFVEEVELSIGVAAGAVLGLLTGVGVFAIPGFGIFYGAGAAAGILTGMGLGTIGGSVIAAITGIKDNDLTTKYEQHLNEGKYLLFAKGSPDEIKLAEKIVGTLGLHLELSSY